MIGVKGMVFGLTTYLFLATDKISWYVWVISILLLIGGRYLDTFLARVNPTGGK
jgi:hypothetical protein